MKMNEKQLAKALLDSVNNMSFDKKLFAQEIVRAHRTLQQQVMEMFLTTINEWSKTKFFDMRNESTIETSKKIMEAINNKTKLPYI